MVDNGSMAAPEQVTIGTNHTQNTTDTPSKQNFDQEYCREIVYDKGYGDQEKVGEIVVNLLTEAPVQVTIGTYHTQNIIDTPFNKNCGQEKVER